MECDNYFKPIVELKKNNNINLLFGNDQFYRHRHQDHHLHQDMYRPMN